MLMVRVASNECKATQRTSGATFQQLGPKLNLADPPPTCPKALINRLRQVGFPSNLMFEGGDMAKAVDRDAGLVL